MQRIFYFLFLLLLWPTDTFAMCGQGNHQLYEHQSDGWHFIDEWGRAASQRFMPNVDTASFKTFPNEADYSFDFTFPCARHTAYAIDKNHVYFAGQIVADADPVTLVYVGSGKIVDGIHEDFVKDKKSVFMNGEKIEGADASSFTRTFSKTGMFYRDKLHVFWGNNFIPDAQPDSYTPLSLGLAVDSKHAFYDGKLVKAADPRSVKMITNVRQWESPYWSDGNKIFFEADELPNAIRASFKLSEIEAASAEDENHYYCGMIRHSIELNKSECSLIGEHFLLCAKDVYLACGKSMDFDPATLHFLGKFSKDCGVWLKDHWIYQDKNSLYSVDVGGGAMKLVGINAPRQFTSIDSELEAIACSGKSYQPLGVKQYPEIPSPPPVGKN